MDMSYETFRDLEAAFRNYHQLPGDWDALIKLNQALKNSGLQNDLIDSASKTIETISMQSVIEEDEWKDLEAAGLSISLFIELNLAQMRHQKDKQSPFSDIYEEIRWLRDDLRTIKNHPNEDHPTLWKQAIYSTKKLESYPKLEIEESMLQRALQNIHLIESGRTKTNTGHKNFASYKTLLAQTCEILSRYLLHLQEQGFKKKAA
jgi:hypothetical protein